MRQCRIAVQLPLNIQESVGVRDPFQSILMVSQTLHQEAGMVTGIHRMMQIMIRSSWSEIAGKPWDCCGQMRTCACLLYHRVLARVSSSLVQAKMPTSSVKIVGPAHRMPGNLERSRLQLSPLYRA